MRRPNWLLGALTIAATLASFFPGAAQQGSECCTFRVIHHFRVCLPQGCQQPQLQWNWNTFAAAWDLNNLPPTINTNSGSAIYSIPSSGSQCISAVVGQDCAFAQACAGFSVDFIPGTNCIQGQHNASGRACTRCRMHGAKAAASSHLVISCPGVAPDGTILWAPQFQDTVGGGCGVQMYDPVILRLRNPRTGDRREETIFELTASGVNWDAQDTNGDGFPDTARINGTKRPPSGHVTLLRRTAGGQGGDSRLHLRFEEGIVTESEATGEFAGQRWPQVGEPMPGPDSEGIEVRAVYVLPIEAPSGWVLDGIEMGGGGDAGQPLPRVEGDVDGNGCVDDADLLIVLFNFGGGGQGDVNGDGIVDDADLLIVLFNFGRGC